MPVIGFLHPASPDAFPERVRGLRQGLKETGFIEGENVGIEYRWAENQIDRLQALAAELVRRRVAVIATTATGARAAKAATTAIPIVFVSNQDPVKLGLVASLARPDGNLTGTNFFAAELSAKQLELLRALVPGANRFAVLVNPADASTTEATLKDMETAARAMGLQIQAHNARTSGEIDTAFATMARERPDALFVSAGILFNNRRVQLAGWAILHKLPAIYPGRQYVEAGDELRRQSDGRVPSGRRLHWPHPKGRQALRSACGAVVKVGASHQSPNRPDAWPHRAADAARPRRRGDRMM